MGLGVHGAPLAAVTALRTSSNSLVRLGLSTLTSSITSLTDVPTGFCRSFTPMAVVAAFE
jgi:hypothetical protein